ncbi:MAG TPA: alpha-N-acetylglucosaminidase C-terminal domain-containing protein, partial [Tepidisphaeraceae bacterium]
DALLANHPINRLDRWVAFARSWGDTEAEKDYYEADAKRLITTWGGGPGLSEYASKTWNGLIESYYRARWQILFDDIKNDKEFAIRDWEEKWIRTPIQSAAPGTGDVLEQCHRIIAKADSEK